MIRWRELPPGAEAGRHPLPDRDDTIAALDDAARERVGRSWSARARAELGAAAVFAVIAQGLFQEAVPAELSWLASRAVLDELRHAQLCREVARRYGIEAPLPNPPLVEEVRFGHADAHVSRLLHAVLNSCI